MATTYLNAQTQNGNMESRINDFKNISPTDTPVLSKIGTDKTDNVTHNWQTEQLNVANADNAQLDGHDSSYAATDYTARQTLLNYTQIMTRYIQVSFTQDAVNKPKLGKGKLSEYDHQKANRMIELNLDAEAMIVSNNDRVAPVPESGTAGKSRGIARWITTNVVDATDAAYSPGRLTQSMYDDAAQKAWEQGGRPKDTFTGIYNKRRIAGFVAPTTRTISEGGKKLVNAVDVYESVAGIQEIHLERNLTTTLLMLQMEYWKLAWLRAPQEHKDGQNGSKTKGFVELEATVVALAENSSAKITGLVVS